MAAPPAPGLNLLGILDAMVHAFAAALQGVVATGVGAPLPYPPTSAPLGRVATLSLLHLRFAYGVVGDSNLPPI